MSPWGPSYRRLQQWAIAISIVSVVYNAAEGGISIGFGSESASRALIFFGIQSAVEVISAAVVIWRFKNLAKPGEEKKAILGERELAFEKRATFVIGGLLLALSLGTEASSVASLVLHQQPDASNSSLIISASALVIMTMIWLPKRYLARALDSSAMRGEAICSLSCVQITIVLFVGSLIFRLWKGGWWVDSATSIILGLLFGWEGIKMIKWARNPRFSGGCCDDCAPIAADGQVELGQQYRDICDCCSEKQECNQSDTCQCTQETLKVEEGKLCCSPVDPEGKKCCSREITKQPKSAQEGTGTERKGVHLNDRAIATGVDECCSPSSKECTSKNEVSGTNRSSTPEDDCCEECANDG